MKKLILFVYLFISTFANAQTSNCDQYWNIAKTSPDREAIKYYYIIINTCHDSTAYFNIGTRYATIAQTLKPADIGIRMMTQKNTLIFQNAVRDSLFKGLAYINKSLRYIDDTVQLLTDRSELEALVAQLTYTSDADRFNHSAWIGKSEKDIALRNSLSKDAANYLPPQQGKLTASRSQPTNNCDQYWAWAKDVSTGNYKRNLLEQIKRYSFIVSKCRDSTAYLEKGDCYIDLGKNLSPGDIGLNKEANTDPRFLKAVSDTLFKGLAFINKSFKYIPDTLPLLTHRSTAEAAIAENAYPLQTDEQTRQRAVWSKKSSDDYALYEKLHALSPRGSQFLADSFSVLYESRKIDSWNAPDPTGYKLYGFKKEFCNQLIMHLGSSSGSLVNLIGYKEYWIHLFSEYMNDNHFNTIDSASSSYYLLDKSTVKSAYSRWEWNGWLHSQSGKSTPVTVKGIFLIDKNDRIKTAELTGNSECLVIVFIGYWNNRGFTVKTVKGEYDKAIETHRNDLDQEAYISQLAYELKGKKAYFYTDTEKITFDLTAPGNEGTLIITKK